MDSPDVTSAEYLAQLYAVWRVECVQTAYDVNNETQVEWQIMYWPDYSPHKRRKRLIWIPILAAGLVLGLIFGGSMNELWGFLTPSDNLQPEPVVSMTAKVSQSQSSRPEAPEFVLPDLFNDSLEYSLSNYDGRPVILNFWASWCVPCRFEMPALQRAYEDHGDSGLVVLGINQTYMDNPAAARDFVDELALTFPNARDDIGVISETLYQVIGLPTSIFITVDGEIAFRKIGQMTDAQIENYSRQLVTGSAITP